MSVPHFADKRVIVLDPVLHIYRSEMIRGIPYYNTGDPRIDNQPFAH